MAPRAEQEPGGAGATRRSSRRDDLRARMDENVMAQRARPVPPWLARPGARRALAVLAAAPLVLGAGAAVIDRSLPRAALTAALLVAFVTVGALLRRATTLLADAPDPALDERELRERDGSYLDAYRLLGAGLSLLVLTAVTDDATGGALLAPDGWVFLTVALLFTALLAPSAVVAWRWREPDQAS